VSVSVSVSCQLPYLVFRAKHRGGLIKNCLGLNNSVILVEMPNISLLR
jgi:hypothetical protein